MIFKPALVLLALAASFAIAANQQQKAKLEALLARFSGTICYEEFEKKSDCATAKLQEQHKVCETNSQDEILAIQRDNEIKYDQLYDNYLHHAATIEACNYEEKPDDRLKCLKTASLSGSKELYNLHTNCTKILDISEEEIRRAGNRKAICINNNLDEFAQEMIIITVELNNCIDKITDNAS